VRGRLKALEREREAVLFGAWKAEWFTRQDKLRPFKHYAKQLKQPSRRGPSRPAERVARYRALAASGAASMKRVALRR